MEELYEAEVLALFVDKDVRSTGGGSWFEYGLATGLNLAELPGGG